jgi:glutathione S-transferase
VPDARSLTTVAVLFYTIPISHYGERARWALDLAGIDYEERHHLQGFAWVPALSRGGKKTLPILVTDDAVLADSADIVRWASDRGAGLFPAEAGAEIASLSRTFADELGVATRRFAYHCVFARGTAFLPFNTGRAPRIEGGVLRAGFFVMRAFMTAYLGVRRRDVEEALTAIDRSFDAVAARLRDGRRYLFGDRLTAADVTFAAMAGPCVYPERYAIPLPEIEDLHPGGRERVLRFREHAAGRFALRLYEDRPVPRGRYVRPLRMRPRAQGFPA